jgi:hypothetical protein
VFIFECERKMVRSLRVAPFSLWVTLLFLWCGSLTIVLVSGVKDSLNFVLPAGKRECYFEDIEADSTRTIEAFIQSVGNVDVQLTIHGPLSLPEIRKVCLSIFCFEMF